MFYPLQELKAYLGRQEWYIPSYQMISLVQGRLGFLQIPVLHTSAICVDGTPRKLSYKSSIPSTPTSYHLQGRTQK